jgi:hypothetical protein
MEKPDGSETPLLPVEQVRLRWGTFCSHFHRRRIGLVNW